MVGSLVSYGSRCLDHFHVSARRVIGWYGNGWLANRRLGLRCFYGRSHTLNAVPEFNMSSLFRRRFETRDTSRNNWIMALLTLGEGWHNNHHRYAGSARQGFYWWELDLTYCGLVVLSAIGLVEDLKGVPQAVLEEVAER